MRKKWIHIAMMTLPVLAVVVFFSQEKLRITGSLGGGWCTRQYVYGAESQPNVPENPTGYCTFPAHHYMTVHCPAGTSIRLVSCTVYDGIQGTGQVTGDCMYKFNYSGVDESNGDPFIVGQPLYYMSPGDWNSAVVVYECQTSYTGDAGGDGFDTAGGDTGDTGDTGTDGGASSAGPASSAQPSSAGGASSQASSTASNTSSAPQVSSAGGNSSNGLTQSSQGNSSRRNSSTSSRMCATNADCGGWDDVICTACTGTALNCSKTCRGSPVACVNGRCQYTNPEGANQTQTRPCDPAACAVSSASRSSVCTVPLPPTTTINPTQCKAACGQEYMDCLDWSQAHCFPSVSDPSAPNICDEQCKDEWLACMDKCTVPPSSVVPCPTSASSAKSASSVKACATNADCRVDTACTKCDIIMDTVSCKNSCDQYFCKDSVCTAGTEAVQCSCTSSRSSRSASSAIKIVACCLGNQCLEATQEACSGAGGQPFAGDPKGAGMNNCQAQCGSVSCQRNNDCPDVEDECYSCIKQPNGVCAQNCRHMFAVCKWPGECHIATDFSYTVPCLGNACTTSSQSSSIGLTCDDVADCPIPSVTCSECLPGQGGSCARTCSNTQVACTNNQCLYTDGPSLSFPCEGNECTESSSQSSTAFCTTNNDCKPAPASCTACTGQNDGSCSMLCSTYNAACVQNACVIEEITVLQQCEGNECSGGGSSQMSSTSKNTSSISRISDGSHSSVRSGSAASSQSSTTVVGGQCDGTECINGGSLFCSALGQSCITMEDLPCIVCSGGGSNGSLGPQGSQASVPPTSDGSASSQTSSITPFGTQCLGNECSNGGTDFCALSGQTCDLITDLPCIVCGHGAASSSPPLCLSTCGNNLRECNEECDDGNLNNDDGCSNTCFLEGGTCGDSVIQQLRGEECEPVLEENGICDPSTCTFYPSSDGTTLPVCGDGHRMGSEECDDGNLNNSDSCDNFCHRNGGFCGDGILQVNNHEECEPSVPTGRTCLSSCKFAFEPTIDNPCVGNECSLGGEAVCQYQGQSCVSDLTNPSCFRCETIIDVSSQSSEAPLTCSGQECIMGGASVCALENKICTTLKNDPCFVCTSPAAPSSLAPSSAGPLLAFINEACSFNSDCITGICRNNLCVPCTSDAQCSSGKCSNGMCVSTEVLPTETRIDPLTGKPILNVDDPSLTLPATVVELPFAEGKSPRIEQGVNEQIFVNGERVSSGAPSTPDTGPAAILIMIGGAAAGWAYRRKASR